MRTGSGDNPRLPEHIRSTASATDPRANFSGATAITYTLDPVDNLVPGTYVVNVEFGDNGAALNYPTLTVGHEETEAFGRNWEITYPMNVRNCESCHTAATSGSWKTNPNRLACMGCHDADEATAHMKAQTYDPTPLAPWSGDEQESCKACH